MRKPPFFLTSAILAAALVTGTPASSAAPPAEGAVLALLYDQSSGAYTASVPSQTSTNGGSSAAADDFTVDSPDGWTVRGFSFAVAYNFNMFGSNRFSYDLHVYPDDGGRPGAAALCSAEAVDGSLDAAPPFAQVTVALPIPCRLPPGTYWVSMQGNTNGDASLPQAATMSVRTYAPGVTPGHVPVWRTLAGTAGCGDWTPLAVCGWTQTALGFSVLGSPDGGTPSGLELSLTVAPDDGDPAQCGSRTEIDATVGDALNFCYTVTNHSGRPFAFHTLVDSIGGTLFSMEPQVLADGETYRYNRIVTAERVHQGYVTAAWTANDDRLAGYDADASGPSQFIDITATGTMLGDIGNDGSRVVDLPFPITYYGVTTSTLGVSNNGAIVVTTTRPVTAINTSLPNVNAALSQPVMFPLWDDFDATTGGTYYATIGTAPNRKFVVQWANRPHYPGGQNTDTASFEVIFDEASGTFSFEYADVRYTANGNSNDPSSVCDGGACATIGVQQDGTYYTQYSFNAASVSDGTSILWRPRVVTPATAEAAVRLNIGAPVISVAPGALTAAAAEGATATALLTVANAGDRDLTWSVDASAADIADDRAHFPASAYVAAATAASTPAWPAAVAGAAPRAATPPAANTVGALPGANVPAFAFGGYGPTGGIHPSYQVYWRLDAADPSALQAYGAMPMQVWVGGAFVGNDFRTQYALNQSGGLFAYDTGTGESSGVGSVVTAGYIATGLAWDATTQTLYASAWDPNSAPRRSYLYRIDLGAGNGSLQAPVEGVRIASIAFDATGHLYGVDADSDVLVALDKRNGEWAGIGPLGLEVTDNPAIAFDPRTGVLWMAAHPAYNPALTPNPAIYTVDTASGRASIVAPVFESVDLTALALAVPYAGCSDASSIPWLSITPAGGVLTAGGSTRLTATFDASGLAAGIHSAQLCVRSDDLSNRIVGVPVTFSVMPSANQPPVAANDAYTALAGQTLQVDAPGVLGNDTDADGDALSAVLLSAPLNGTLTLQPDGGFVYTPAHGFVGVDAFTYAASDGTGNSAPATVTITVRAGPAVDLIFDDGFEVVAP